MQFRPILSALRRNKVGAFLIALQMAATLAILCNALFIIQQRMSLMARPTGVDEANVFTLSNQWIGPEADRGARLAGDLAALRSLPGVVDAFASNSFPLRGGGWSDGLRLDPDQKTSTTNTALYMADEHALNTLGVRLVAGRNFTPDEVSDRQANDQEQPPAAIVTQALADKLFPQQSALGKVFYDDKKPIAIVGIIDRLQVPWVSNSWGEKFVENSMLQPYHFLTQGIYYVVRTQPGQLDAVTQQAQKTLSGLSRARVIDKVRSFTEVRARAYRDDRAVAVILGVMCTALLAVTAFGIVGLTSFWVTQRRRQIGVRRALGATRNAILAYFQTENVMIAAAAAVVGVALALGLNLWMVTTFEMNRIGVVYVLSGAVAVVLLGQFAVLWPALRAASIPPALATRAA
jgi:putative ABC transport system permease protein